MEEVYLSLKQGVETETETLKAKFDELQARVLEADAKRDQVGVVVSAMEASGERGVDMYREVVYWWWKV